MEFMQDCVSNFHIKEEEKNRLLICLNKNMCVCACGTDEYDIKQLQCYSTNEIRFIFNKEKKMKKDVKQ